MMQLDDYHLANPELKQSLATDGFCELKALVDPAQWNDVFACPKVHHGRMLTQVRDGLAALDATCGWTSVLGKFRAGASCGASKPPFELSRDLSVYGSTVPPIFTLVIFLDDSTMRVEPKSHVNVRLSLVKGLKTRGETRTFAAGSALLMHATLLHSDITRGERVVFCMDLFPSPEVAAVYSPRTLHLRTSAIDEPPNHLVKVLKARAQSVRAARGNRMEKPLPSDVTMISHERDPRVPQERMNEFVECGGCFILPEASLRGVDDDENDAMRQDFCSLKAEGKTSLVYLLVALVTFVLVWRALFKTN